MIDFWSNSGFSKNAAFIIFKGFSELYSTDESVMVLELKLHLGLAHSCSIIKYLPSFVIFNFSAILFKNRVAFTTGAVVYR